MSCALKRLHPKHRPLPPEAEPSLDNSRCVSIWFIINLVKSALMKYLCISFSTVDGFCPVAIAPKYGSLVMWRKVSTCGDRLLPYTNTDHTTTDQLFVYWVVRQCTIWFRLTYLNNCEETFMVLRGCNLLIFTIPWLFFLLPAAGFHISNKVPHTTQ